jgi:TetR/AcrR family transcriptional regulator, lmrAB and yxaGH operons repressor
MQKRMAGNRVSQIDKRPTRERLIRAALHLFQSQGYHGTGIIAILARAKTPKGSFYHHFPGGKEELAVATLFWLADEVTRFLDQLAATGAGSDMMVEGLARYTAEGIRKKGITRGFLMSVLAQDAAPNSRLVASAVRTYAGLVRTRIATARAMDHPRDNAEDFADQAMAMVQGAGVMARVEGNAERAVEIVELWLRTISLVGEKGSQ